MRFTVIHFSQEWILTIQSEIITCNLIEPLIKAFFTVILKMCFVRKPLSCIVSCTVSHNKWKKTHLFIEWLVWIAYITCKCLDFNVVYIKCELWTAQHINHVAPCSCHCISQHEWHLSLTSVAVALSVPTYLLLTVHDSVNTDTLFRVPALAIRCLFTSQLYNCRKMGCNCRWFLAIHVNGKKLSLRNND